jgi:hypothetical protein
MIYVRKREEAITLRKAGKTYSEILKSIPVAKSTLSLWLRDVGLSRVQIQRITEKRIAGQKKGAKKRHTNRVALQKKIFSKAIGEIRSISERELWLIGIALYWAEGSKEKEYQAGSGLVFSNSDPRMIRLYLRWLKRSLKVDSSRLVFELYVHINRRGDLEMMKKFWAQELGCSTKTFKRVYFKKNILKTKRHNTTHLYHGLVRVKVSGSSTILRQIEGWVRGITSYCGIV